MRRLSGDGALIEPARTSAGKAANAVAPAQSGGEDRFHVFLHLKSPFQRIVRNRRHELTLSGFLISRVAAE